MNVFLKTLSNAIHEIKVNTTDTIGSMCDKLLEKKIVKEDQEVKFILDGKILEHTDTLDKYDIKEGTTLVLFTSKKKTKRQNVISPQTTSVLQNPVAIQQIATPTPVAIQQIATPTAIPPPVVQNTSNVPTQLPSTYQGVDINMLRNTCVSIALTNVLSNRNKFLQILLENPQIQIVRAADPIGFDNLIRHPQFLPHSGSINISGGAYETPTDDQKEDEDIGNTIEETKHSNTAVNQETTQLTIEQLQEVRNGWSQMQSMGVDTTFSEMLQMYVACDNNINIVIDNMLSFNYQ